MKYIDNRLNAKIVKLEDANNNFVNDNVEDALNEIDSKIKNIETDGYDDTQLRQSINNIKTELGTVGLVTTNQTIKGGINEVNSRIDTLNSRVDNIANNSGGSIDTSSFATKAELNTNLSQKQDKLVSGTNIKTINGQSLLGNGDIEITGGSSIDTSNFATKTDLANKQNLLVSGTNVKTINGQSILGSGNIEITSSGGSGTNFFVSYNEVNEELTITSTTENNIIYNESTESLTIGGAD